MLRGRVVDARSVLERDGREDRRQGVRAPFLLGALRKAQSRARSLIPATTVVFAPRISNWTRLEALGKMVFRAG